MDTGVLLARGGFEPQHSEERLHPKYPWPFATDPVKVRAELQTRRPARKSRMRLSRSAFLSQLGEQSAAARLRLPGDETAACATQQM